MAEGKGTPVVKAVKMPKLKLSSKAVVAVNAVTVTGALYLGILAIMGGVSALAKWKWSVFGTPEVKTWLFGGASSLFTVAVLAVALAVMGYATINKITDANALKKAYGVVAVVMTVWAGLMAVGVLATGLYGLMGVGDKSGISHTSLWLGDFIPLVIKLVVTVGLALLARKIAEGKIEVLRLMSLVMLGIVGLGLILAVVQTFIGFYAKPASSLDSLKDWTTLFDR